MPILPSNVYELRGPRDVAICQNEIDLDHLAPDHIAAETLYSAVSPGTELAAYVGAPPLRPMRTYPRLVGYCNLAEVVRVGSAVKNIEAGQRVLTFQSHRSSFSCPAGDVIAVVEPTIEPTHATLTYLFHLGYSALLKGGMQPGCTVAVVGLGTLGLATVAVAVLAGADVFALTNQPGAQDMARSLGARLAVRKDMADLSEVLAAATHGTGVDIVVTTSNAWIDWTLALQVARKNANICVLGFPGRGLPLPDCNPLASEYFYDKQLSLVSCGYVPDVDLPAHDLRFTIKRNCRYLLGCIGDGRLPAQKFISSVECWDRLDQVYRTMAERDQFRLTTVLRWR